MGNKQSKRVGYQELRESIAGSLVSDQDFELFYSLCKVETVRTISNVLHPNNSQLFFVVVSGEVSVNLTSTHLKQKSVVALTYHAGETIHFYNLPVLPPSTNFEFNDQGECFRNGDIKLSLIFKSCPKSAARVIGMDRRAYDEFCLTAKSNLHMFTSFIGLNMVQICQQISPYFRAITPEQVSIFAPLVKVRLTHSGKVVAAYPSIESADQTAAATMSDSKKSYKPFVTKAPDECHSGCMTMVLSGTVLSVPNGTNMSALIAKITGVEASFNRKKKNTPLSGLNYRAPPSMPVSATASTSLPAVFSLAEIEKSVGSADRDNSNRGRSPIELGTGSITSIDGYLQRNCRMSIRSYVTTTPSVLGYISHAAMDALFEADPRFARVFARNVYKLALHWVKSAVPFLMDMDEWSLALLSCKVFMRGYDTGVAIKKAGEASDYAFIVLGGCCKEVFPSTPTPGKKDLVDERFLRWGALFGEMALTTNVPYFRTVVATEPTTLLCLSKRVLDQIYHNNKAKLSEIRIRLMGTEVDMKHAIDHPRGSELFLAFLTSQRAAENLNFYKAVDKFDSMCRVVAKRYVQVMKLKDKIPGQGQKQEQEQREEQDQGQGQEQNSATVTSGALLSEESGTAGTSEDHFPGSTTTTTGTGMGADTNTSVAATTTGIAVSYIDSSDKTSECAQSMVQEQDSERIFSIHTNATTGAFGSDKTSASSTRSNDSFQSFQSLSLQPPQVRTKPVPAFQRPHMEPIISVSNFAHFTGALDDDDSTKGESRTAFSIKLKPQPSSKLPNSRKSAPVVVGGGNDDGGEVCGFSERNDAGTVLSSQYEWEREKGQELELGISERSLRQLVESNNVPGIVLGATAVTSDTHTHGTEAGSDLMRTFSANIDEAAREALMSEQGDGEGGDLTGQTTRTGFDSADCDPMDNSRNRTPEGDAHPTAAEHYYDRVTVGVGFAGAVVEDALKTATKHATPNSKRRHHRSSFMKDKAAGRSAAYEAGDRLGDHHDADATSELNISNMVQGHSDGRDKPFLVDVIPPSQHQQRGGGENSEFAMKVSRQMHKIRKNIAELREVARSIIHTFIYEGAPQQVNIPGPMRVRTERAFEEWSSCLLSSSGKGVIVLSKSREGSFVGLDQTQQDNAMGDSAGSASGADASSSSVVHLGMMSQSYSYRADGAPESFAASLKAQHINGSGLVPAPLLTETAADAGGLSSRLAALSLADSPYPVSSSSAQQQTATGAVGADTTHQEHQHQQQQGVHIEQINFSFVDLFKESKGEILKLLRDDKFPRWKATREFQTFIANVKPYEKDGHKAAGEHSGSKPSDIDRSGNTPLWDAYEI